MSACLKVVQVSDLETRRKFGIIGVLLLVRLLDHLLCGMSLISFIGLVFRLNDHRGLSDLLRFKIWVRGDLFRRGMSSHLLFP